MSFWSLDNPKRTNSTLVILASSYIILAVNIVQNILFVPLYINIFGERLYGLWLATGGVAMMLSFFDLGIPSLMIQRIAREYSKKNFEGIAKYFFTGVVLHVCLMILLFLTGLVVLSFLDSIVPIKPEELQILKTAFLVSTIASCVSLINNGIEGVANALQKPIFVKSSMIVGGLVALCSIYIGMTIFDLSIVAIPLGLLIGAIIPFTLNLIFVFILFRKNNIPMYKFDKSASKDYLSLIPSIFFSKLGSSISNSIEPTLIARFVAPEMAVYYSVTVKAAGLIKTILNRVVGSLFPSFAHYFGSNNINSAKEIFLKITKVILLAGVIFYCYYVLFNKSFVDIWVGSENYISDVFTLLVALAFFFSFTSNFSSYLLGATGDIKIPSQLIFVESLSKIIFLYIALIFFGVIGIPISVAFVSLIFIVIYAFRWKNLLKLEKSEMEKYFKSTFYAILLILGISGVLIGIDLDLHNFINIGAIFIAYSLTIGYILYVLIDEIKLINNKIKRKISLLWKK